MTEWSVCLNPRDANSRTYQTWVTIRFEGCKVEWRTNKVETAGGQRWSLLGYLRGASELALFTTTDNEKGASRVVATVVRRLGLATNVGGFGAAWSNATVERCYRSRHTGRMLRAAPSVRDGRPQRDRNRDEMREKVGGGFTEAMGSVNPLLAAARSGRI